MKESGTVVVKRVLSSFYRYLGFFAMVCFIITCCLMLFLNQLLDATGWTLDGEDLTQAGIITFANVMLLSLILTITDAIQRVFLVNRPVKRIIAAAEQIMKGDLSVRIQPYRTAGMEGFNTIIHYFNQMAQELAGIEILRTDFIANVSHELKTPLSVINSYGTILQQPELSDEKRISYAKSVTDASRRLANLISNILKLNKLENQKIFPEKKVYNLSEQLCECLLSFEHAWEQKDLEINTEIEDDILIEGDAELMSLVWNNLFSNAIKFTAPGGKVYLQLKTDGDWAFVKVTDTGCGISADVGPHIFEKFYQGDTSHATQGNGLGLALVKRVVDIVEGDISVESELGEGSTFTVKVKRFLHDNEDS